MQELLMERGMETHEVVLVFKEFDSSGDGQLDSEEFKRALDVLGVRLPPSKVRLLFHTSTCAKILTLTLTRFANFSARSTRTTLAISRTMSSVTLSAPIWTRRWPIPCGKQVGGYVVRRR